MPDANRIIFTQARIEALKPSAERRYVTLYDRKKPGLCVQVGKSGVKSFFLYRRIAGRPERVKLGRFPMVTVDQARLHVDRLNGAIASGQNPAKQKREAPIDESLGDLFSRYHRLYACLQNRRPEKKQSLWDQHLARWNRRPVGDLTADTVRRWHAKVGESSGTTQANRALQLLRAVYAWSIKRGYYVGANPCDGVDGHPEVPRDRYLKLEEIPRFFSALQEEPNPDMRDFFLIALFTGARKGNVAAMRWDDIDRKRAVWRVPAGSAKAGKSIDIELVGPVQEILGLRRLKTGPGCAWVFPGRGAAGHITKPQRAWKRVLARAGIVDLRLHDLRRSLATVMATAGVSDKIVGRSLGHAPGSKSTQVYAHLADQSAVRDSVEAAVAFMLHIAGDGVQGTAESRGQ